MGSSRFHVRFRLLTAAAAMLLVLGACSDEKVSRREPQAVWTPIPTDQVAIEDSTFNFGTVRLGEKVTGYLQVENLGSAPGTVKYPTTLEAPFSINIPGAGLTIGVGEKKLIEVTFAPTEADDYEWNGVLELVEDADQKIAVRLVGVGEAPAFSCDTEKLDFGKVVKGRDKKLSVTCTNNSNVEGKLVINKIDGPAVFRHFFADGARELVAPGASLEIVVEYKANIDGPSTGRLLLESELNGVTERVVRVVLSGVTLDHVISCQPTIIDYGFVAPESTKTEEVTCQNQGSDPFHLTAMEFAPGADVDAFEWDLEFPVEVPAAVGDVPGEVKLPLTFHPKTPHQGQTKQARLILNSDDPGTPRVDIVLTGFAGGPVITCNPSAADFGLVPTEQPNLPEREFTCSNVGTDDYSRADDVLLIQAIESTNPEFIAEIVGNANPNGYAVGESFVLKVKYDPVDEGTDSAAILLHSNAINATVDTPYAVTVSGIGRNLPPCDFEVIPEELRFGIVEKNRTANLEIAVRNNLQDAECLIQNVNLVGDLAFKLILDENAERDELLPPQGEIRYRISFSPPEYRESRYTAELHFDISNPDTPHVVVPISGASQEPCALIAPNDLDFGAVEPGCATRDREFEIINLCSAPLVVQSAELGQGFTEEFFLRSFPPANTTVAPGASVIFTMAYRPVDQGEDLGAVYVYVQGSQEAYTAMLRGAGVTGAEQHEEFEQNDRPKVDILWVIDNSGSMSPYQNAIANNLAPFLSFAQAQQIDYQIGVTTTGIITGGSCPGGAQGGEKGRLFPVDNSHPRILTPYTPDLEAHWAHNIRVGTCHYDEQPLEAAYMALTPPLIDHCDDPDSRTPTPWPNDGNCGFLRPEAHLSIIAVQDEPDQSPGNINFYYNAFQSLKGFRNTHMFNFHAICGDKTGGSCLSGDGERLIAMVEKTNGGVHQSLCATDWEAALRDMSAAAFGFKTCFNLMSEPADQNANGHISDLETGEDGKGEIEVKLNGRKLSSKGQQGQTIWTYDRSQNAICFEALTVPEPGSQLEVDYKVACINWEE
jgi:hypothetical protein